VENNRDFVLSKTEEKEHILVLTVNKHQSLYFDGNRRVSAFNPGLAELFLNADLNRFNQLAMDSSYPIFIEANTFNYTYIQPALAAIAARYEFNGAGKSMAMVTRRRTPIPSVSFFADTGRVLLHRKYTDDTGGLAMRMADAIGVAGITVPQVFSVQLLFYSKIQVYRDAVLAGNLRESRGFVISNQFNAPDFLFGVNEQRWSVRVPQNQWVYAVLNVYPDHAEIYIDGSLAGSAKLTTPMQQSDQMLSIGNLGYMHYYTGAISEAAISAGCIPAGQVGQTWEHIKTTTGQ